MVVGSSCRPITVVVKTKKVFGGTSSGPGRRCWTITTVWKLGGFAAAVVVTVAGLAACSSDAPPADNPCDTTAPGCERLGRREVHQSRARPGDADQDGGVARAPEHAPGSPGFRCAEPAGVVSARAGPGATAAAPTPGTPATSTGATAPRRLARKRPPRRRSSTLATASRSARSIPVGTPGGTVVPDSVPDAAFADALRPYVEAVRPCASPRSPPGRRTPPPAPGPSSRPWRTGGSRAS